MSANQHANQYANEAETSLKLFHAVSVFCFGFISECATGFGPARTDIPTSDHSDNSCKSNPHCSLTVVLFTTNTLF